MVSMLDLYEKNQDNVSDKQRFRLDFYNRLLQPYKDRPIRILEVGVQNGEYLDLWENFFSNALCIARCDIENKCADLKIGSKNVKVLSAEATQDELLKQVRANCDQFDVIIDNGSHKSSDIIHTFTKVFPMVSHGGLYICGDIYCNYEGDLDNPQSAPAIFRSLSDYVILNERASLRQFENICEEDISESIVDQIYSVGFSNFICHIEKCTAEHDTVEKYIPYGSRSGIDRVDTQKNPVSAQQDKAKFDALEQDLRLARHELLKERSQLVFLEGVNAGLKADLAKARNHPWDLLKDKVNFKFLTILLNSGLPISDRSRGRFNKSARKRNPMRSLTAAETNTFRETDYEIWMRKKEPKHHLKKDQVEKINSQAECDNLVISIIMPVYNPDPNYLELCILSVLEQSFQNWQFCIADDASTDPEVHAVLRKYAEIDERISVTFREENGHISAASNSALAMATGAYVALLDHDDALPEHALAHVAKAIQDNPELQLIYSDEDKLNNEGRRIDPHFKSDWNRDLFYSQNYITHFSVIDRSIMTHINGFRVGYEGAQDYDLLLRVIAQIPDENIHHIAKILYHWRAHEGSTAMAAEAKSYTHIAGKRALEDFMRENEPAGVTVNDGKIENMFHVSWPLPEILPKVSIIIPTRDYLGVLRTAVISILEKTSYSNYEIVIVDNGSVEQETLDWFATMQAQHENLRVLRYDAPFNYSAINNFAVEQVHSDIIALVNNDIEVISPDWLNEMAGHALRDDIGCVGAKLYFSNGQIQHGGVIIGIGGMAGHAHKYFDGHHHGYFSRLFATQNLSAVTAACLVMRRSVFLEVGGLDAENLAVAFNDVDLCLKVQAAGYRNLWSPYAELFHHESISRGGEDTPEKKARFQEEVDFSVDKWKPQQVCDRYYNPNLSQEREDFSLDISDDEVLSYGGEISA